MVVFFSALLVYSVYFGKFDRSTSPPSDDSVLELRLEGELPESTSDDPFLRLFAGQQMSLRQVVENIQKAKVDKHIKGVLLIIDSLQIRQGKVEEIRDALIDFKTSGKPVYAYMERGDDLEYYLATVADKIYVSPAGDLSVKGLAASAMYYRGLFNKLKIEPNIERHGKYKSFGDRYTRENMSEAEREELEALLDDLYQNYTEAIAQARKLDIEQVKQIIDNGPYGNARKAQEAGLIDGTNYLDEVKDQFKEQLKLAKYVGTQGSKYAHVSPREFGLYKGEKIAVINAVGGVVSGKSNNSPFGERTLGSETVAAAIKKAREDNDIKAIILRIDSPGGSGLASDIIWREVALTKGKKPIIASMSDVAASGGYYIAMAADKIVAQPGTLTGSIGVVSGKLNIGGLYQDHLGLTVETIKRGRNADILSEYRNFTEEERTKFRQDMMDFYNLFVTKVAEGRKMEFAAADAVAQGRVWTGRQAKERGLVDELGGMDKAIAVAKDLAKLPANSSPQLVEFPRHRSFTASLFGDSDEDAEESDARTEMERKAVAEMIGKEVPADMRETLRMLSLMKQLQNEHVWAIPPYMITIR